MQSYSNHSYARYCSKFGYLQSFTWFDVGVFCAMLCKFLYFMYFAMTDAIA